jgi:hypothetical protein
MWPYLALFAAACNIIDAVSTLAAIDLGWAYEANPLMAMLIAKSHYGFLILKCAVSILMAATSLWTRYEAIRIAVLVFAIEYGLLVAYHAAMWITVLR